MPHILASDQAHVLARRLRERIDGEVRFDAGSRALYATDASLYRQAPIGVVIPRHAEDVMTTIALCREADAPLLSRGAGTSLAGQCCNTAVIIDFSKYMNRIIALDAEHCTATVEPGCVLDVLRAAAERHHLTFGPDPATHTHNTLGGMIGNNSCGVHSVMAGRTADNVEALEIATYDGLRMWIGGESEAELRQRAAAGGREGEIFAGLLQLREAHADEIRTRFPDIPRRVSGYCLEQLLPEHGSSAARALVGSEGTCVVVLAARLKLIPSPPCRSLLVLGYSDICAAAAAVPCVLEHGPVGCEGLDEVLVEQMRKKGLNPGNAELLPEGGAWLLVEFGGDSQEQADARARRLCDTLSGIDPSPSMRLCSDPRQQTRLWEIRESGLGATAEVPGQPTTHPGWEDAAVPPARLAEYLRDFRQLLDRYGYQCSLYGHFGDGCVHCRISFDFESDDGVAAWRRFMDDAADLVLRYGGSLSGEHGDGQVRAALLPKMYGESLMQAFRDFKRLWDPLGGMNPGKLIDAYPIDANLRRHPGLHLPKLASAFTYPADHGDFGRATLRCVGVGKCRKQHGEVMCPSYRATGEEMHSTRGRARLLFEMLQGEVITDGFRNDSVREALHLCLACKACKRDCPVDVDMASYKAEFMARHYHRRLRPRDAYSMGLIFWWARMGSQLPRLSNALLRGRLSAAPLKWLAGIARARNMPAFARPTFRRWFRDQRAQHGSGKPVVLWADTFGNYFDPAPLQAAVALLRAAGFAPWVAPRPICCGRPLYPEGMLALARGQLGDTLDALREPIERGWPLVGIEPACMSSFRDELPRLLPNDARAHHLAAHSFLLGEFLQNHGYRPPAIGGRALLQVHCTQHADFGAEADCMLLAAAGVEVETLDAGCCGMAGSFGMSHDRFDVSLQIAEHALLPALRRADPDVALLATGFSCREQIQHCHRQRPLSVPELLQRGLPH
jgi:FAD/FMN-containing dehydrogenase/Fe-S oxidoreductase